MSTRKRKKKVVYYECPICGYRSFTPELGPNWRKANRGILALVPSCPKCSANMQRRVIKTAKKKS